MKPILKSSLRRLWSPASWLIVKTLVFLTRMGLRSLRQLSKDQAENLVEAEIPTQPVPPRMTEKIHKNGFKSKSLEITSSKGFTYDALNKNTPKLTRPRWTEEIDPFLANQLSDHTRRAYQTDLKQFFQFLKGRLDPGQIEHLRADHVILFRKALEEGRLSGRPMAKSTVNRKLAVIKSFLGWLKTHEYVSKNVAERVKGFPQSQESSLKGLSDEEVCRILDLPSRNSRAGSLHLAVLHVLFFLGLRKGELIHLRMGDLDSERGVRVLRVRGKGHRVRILPITEKIHLALEHYFRACQRKTDNKDAPLFTPTKNPHGGELLKPLNPNAITYMITRYARKAGILKPISPHSCRATCISNALDRRATHRSVQHLAGWSTPLMIQRYDKRREDLKNSAAFLIDYTSDEAEPKKSAGTSA